MPTLLQWKGVCRASQEQVTKALRGNLSKLLRRFVPANRELLRIVTHCRAFIGGSLALAFLLPDTEVETMALDIFTDDVCFETFLDLLRYTPSIAPHLTYSRTIIVLKPHRIHRAVSRIAIFNTASGRRVFLHESTTISGCSPISRSWTSALINFVTESTFGCAYPRLTFNKRAIVADMHLFTMTFEERGVLANLYDIGFSLAFHPGQWSEYEALVEFTRSNGMPAGNCGDSLFPCFRALYICPDQGRYFGDPGSLVGFFDPVVHGPRTALMRSMPPFGPMAAWRLWVSASCEEGCAHHDPVLPGCALSMPMTIDPSLPFLRPISYGPRSRLSTTPMLTALPMRVRGRRAFTI
ncbi:hypothetical protein C8Q76DRAFT_634001 [Earliella scabrosa]|nr:hypothetical protein C8Q76DRAFT_634001 [Earliella scabrosa]